MEFSTDGLCPRAGGCSEPRAFLQDPLDSKTLFLQSDGAWLVSTANPYIALHFCTHQ